MEIVTNSVLVQGGPIEFQDHQELANKYLSPKAQEAVSKKAYTQVIQVPGTMKSYMTVYLVSVVDNDKIEEGIQKISKVLNDLADKDLIHSVLCPPSSVKLATVPMVNDSSVVFAYPLVDADKLEEARDLAGDTYTSDNGSLNIVGQEKILPEGQFYANIRLSAWTYSESSYTTEDRLQKQIEAYLNILPKGTEVVSVKKCSITGLSLPYEVIFSNPLLKQIKQVELNYVRMAELMGDRVEQFNLLTGIRYTKRDGTIL